MKPKFKRELNVKSHLQVQGEKVPERSVGPRFTARADALAPLRAMATTTTAIVWSGGGEASRAGPNEGKTFVHFGPSCTLCTFLADLPRHSPNVTRCRVNLITLKEFHTRGIVQNMDETIEICFIRSSNDADGFTKPT